MNQEREDGLSELTAFGSNSHVILSDPKGDGR